MIRYCPVMIMFLLMLSANAQYEHEEGKWYYESNIDFNHPQQGQWIRLRASYIRFSCETDMGYAEYFRAVDSISFFLSRFSECLFLISFHSDCRADSVYNMALTQRRADTLQAQLSRITPVHNFRCVGKGESEPVNNCQCEGSWIMKRCTEEEHQQNKRLLLRVVECF